MSKEVMASQETFLAFQLFGYHVSMENDKKHPQLKFGENWFMGAQDTTAWIPN